MLGTGQIYLLEEKTRGQTTVMCSVHWHQQCINKCHFTDSFDITTVKKNDIFYQNMQKRTFKRIKQDWTASKKSQ